MLNCRPKHATMQAATPNDDPVVTTANCVFEQPWWLDTVAPSSWHAITVERAGRVAARWPLVTAKRAGMTWIRMPSFTPCLGPWIEQSSGKYPTRLAREKELLDELLEQLPPFHYFSVRLHPSRTNWLPLYWRGFKQTTRYTYVLPDLSDLDAVWRGMRENVRREIRKAEKKLVVTSDVKHEDLVRVIEMTYQRQGRSLRTFRALLDRIHDACTRHETGRILAAVDSRGRVHAALRLVWDDNAAYYLAGGGNPELRTSGAHSLLMREAIKLAATVSRSFDFEGSMVEPIERFFRSFGAIQTPYSHVTKAVPRTLAGVMALREVFRR